MDAISGWCGEGARAAFGLCSSPAICLRVTWRARLSEHLGGFNVELIEAHAARVLDDAAALAAIGSLAGLARLLPERDPHPELYAAALDVLARLRRPRALAGAARALGASAACRSSASASISANARRPAPTADLVYVSPRSGRAVSREAGQPY